MAILFVESKLIDKYYQKGACSQNLVFLWEIQILFTFIVIFRSNISKLNKHAWMLWASSIPDALLTVFFCDLWAVWSVPFFQLPLQCCAMNKHQTEINLWINMNSAFPPPHPPLAFSDIAWYEFNVVLSIECKFCVT